MQDFPILNNFFLIAPLVQSCLSLWCNLVCPFRTILIVPLVQSCLPLSDKFVCPFWATKCRIFRYLTKSFLDIWMSRFRHLDVPFWTSGCPVLDIWMLTFQHLDVGFSASGCWLFRIRMAGNVSAELWLFRNLVCGFPANLFVAFPQSCLWLSRKLNCGFPAN